MKADLALLFIFLHVTMAFLIDHQARTGTIAEMTLPDFPIHLLTFFCSNKMTFQTNVSNHIPYKGIFLFF